MDRYNLIAEGKILNEGTFSFLTKILKNTQSVDVAISKVWKGTLQSNKVTIKEHGRNTAACREKFGFEIDKSYLIFAEKVGDDFYASTGECNCAASAPLETEQARKDILQLEELTNRK